MHPRIINKEIDIMTLSKALIRAELNNISLQKEKLSKSPYKNKKELVMLQNRFNKFKQLFMKSMVTTINNLQ